MWKQFCIVAIMCILITFLPILEEPLNVKIDSAKDVALILTICAGLTWGTDYFVYKKKVVAPGKLLFYSGLIASISAILRACAEFA